MCRNPLQGRRQREDRGEAPVGNGVPSPIGEKFCIPSGKMFVRGSVNFDDPRAKQNRILEFIFDSLERAYKHKKVSEEFQAEILLKLLGDKASNVLVNIKEEDLKDYAKVKALILKEFEPTPRACLENFRKAKRNSGENHNQIVSRLTSTWEYYCKLRKVEDCESLKKN
ncbi:hypothetical protein AVEN_127657-1 [Araneus ventricosus]|uniref:Uncharacterized protein n=1 Tax=Araneus ventricosus TaxID=182803 RepID=A0A4Y2LPS7_ARAVE|nr:hypothetical protein AVEN_127657-1 [Araneus ventricosus]